MATLNTTALSLSDQAIRTDPDKKVAKIVEVIAETNEILDEMMWVEANDTTGHTSVIRTGYPTPTWRLFNSGVPRTKTNAKQVTDTVGMLEDYSVVDRDLAMLNGNTIEFRASEDKGKIQAMGEEMSATMFYGAKSSPEEFVGFAPRFDGTPQEADEKVSTYNIVDGGGTGSDNTSIWLVVWGAMTCFGTFPKGSTAGLQARDLGEDTVTDSSGNEYQAFRTHYQWKAGLVVRDWRYVVRIANIDISNLTKDAATGADLIDLMMQATERIPQLNMGKAAFYCNRTIRSFLRRQIVNKDNVNLTFDNVAGKRVLAFDEIPVRRVDSLLNTETQVA